MYLLTIELSVYLYAVEQEPLMQLGAGDATLAALLLANRLAIKPIRDGIKVHDESNPDSASFKAVGQQKKEAINDAFVALTKKANPDFDPSKQMAQAIIKPDYANYPGAMARNTNVTPETFTIKHNPGIDRTVYAHELGHILAQNTPVARQINDVRKQLQYSPKLTQAIDKGLDMIGTDSAIGLKGRVKPAHFYGAAKYMAPAVASGLIEGDDDLAASVAINLALASPVLADEAIASMNGLRIMKEAGDPATLKQRGRMAAAFGSYLAAPLMAALGGNIVGNLVD